MRILLLSMAIILVPLSHAQNGVNQAAVNKMIKDFKAKGILNDIQAKEVEQKINNISPKQWGAIKQQAQQMNKEAAVPATNTTNSVDAAAGLIDTNSPEFKKTMERMKGILEQE